MARSIDNTAENLKEDLIFAERVEKAWAEPRQGKVRQEADAILTQGNMRDLR